MTDSDQGRISGLFCYPIKGLSAQPQETVELEVGETFPGDRAYALENGPSDFDADAPTHQPKAAFLMLMSQPALAKFRVAHDPDTGQLSIFRDGDLVLSANLESGDGRQTIEAFFNAAMSAEARGPIRLLRAPGISFSDMNIKLVHIINLATVHDFGRSVHHTVDPARFRANIQVEGFPAGAERKWIGKKLNIGSVELEVVEETGRCAATNVHPEQAIRDMTIPAELERLYGHTNFGVYAKVTQAGSISTGGPVEVRSD
jgi:uncharacterized protein YcbX